MFLFVGKTMIARIIVFNLLAQAVLMIAVNIAFVLLDVPFQHIVVETVHKT